MKRREFMAYLFVKSPARTTMVLLTTLIAIFFFSTMAGAAIYDDFASPGINTDKWTINGDGFTQPGDGYLYYSGATPVKEKLTSTKVFPSGIFTMPFANYSSNNNAPPGEGLGSVMALGLGSRNSGAWVRIERGQVLGTPIGQYIEVNWSFQINGEWSKIYVNYVQSDIISGFLQLRYDGTNVTFFYRTLKTDPWTQMVITAQGGQPVIDDKGQTQPLVITPGWTTAVPMFIQAIPGGDDGTPSYTLSFKVDNVRTNSLPVAKTVDKLHDIITAIHSLETFYFKNANQPNALTKKLHAVVEKVEQGFYTDSIHKLQKDILQKTDGCNAKGRPDKNDWITDCYGQDIVYPLIYETILLLQGLI